MPALYQLTAPLPDQAGHIHERQQICMTAGYPQKRSCEANCLTALFSMAGAGIDNRHLLSSSFLMRSRASGACLSIFSGKPK